MHIFNLLKSLYFNFRYLPFRQAIYMPVWITANFKVRGLRRGMLVLHQPYRKSVFLGDCGSPGLQEMKGGLFFSAHSRLILHGFTVVAQGSVLRLDEDATIEIGRNFYCNKNCFFRSSSKITFGEECLLGWNVQINTSDGHVVSHDGVRKPSELPVAIGNHVWLTANTIVTKGVSVAVGCIIAQGAVVTKSVDEPNILSGGGEFQSAGHQRKMGKMTTISIIVPIYNTGDKLQRCLQSVSAQTFKDFECLMVDDGSTDQSPSLIDRFAREDARFKAVHKKNGGVSSARNEGLERANGQWVVFLDSDDILKPNHVEALLAAAVDGVDVVFTGFEQMVADNRMAEGHRYERGVYVGKEGIARFLGETAALSYMIPWDRMYRRKVIEDGGVRFDTKLSLSEDRLFCYHYLLHAHGIATIPEITYVHDASDKNSLSYRFYPFEVNAYKHDVFVDVTGKLLSQYPFSDHAVFLLWKYTWDLMALALSSLYDAKKNIFAVSGRQKDFFRTHFGWNLYDMVRNTSEVIDFSKDKTFQMATQGRFLQWNFGKTIHYIKYKLHISR